MPLQWHLYLSPAIQITTSQKRQHQEKLKAMDTTTKTEIDQADS